MYYDKNLEIKDSTATPAEKRKIAKVVNSVINDTYSKTDPNGSYTGRPKNPKEIPVQDADDL